MATTQQSFDSKQPPFGRNQYLKDYAYAIRHLKQGETEEEVTKQIANFRKDLKASDAVEYAKRTVDKANTAIEHENAIAESLAQQEVPIDDGILKVLDNHLEELKTEEYARRLYASGMDTDTIELLEQHRGLSTDEAVDVANKAAAQVHAEKDVSYAVNQLRREKPEEEIAAAITRYRGVAVENPQQYGQDVVKTAKTVIDVEKDVPTQAMVDARTRASAHKFTRDVNFAYNQLTKTGNDQQILLDIQARNPTAALNNFNYQVLGQTDHSYTLAVFNQAQALQTMMKQGSYSLPTALVVVQNDFGKDLSGAIEQRRFGIPRVETIGRISEGEETKQRYAQAVVNNAEHIVNEERSLSVRPELARQLASSYKRQESVRQTNFHSADNELEKPKNGADKLADQRASLNIPADAKINTANNREGVYYGQLISQTADKYIQQTGAQSVVTHSKLDLGSDLKVGDTYQVRYNQGKPQVKHYPTKERRNNGNDR